MPIKIFASGSAPRYTPERKGEVNEMRAQLRDPAVQKDPAKMREAVKRVVAYMTLGLDTSALAPEVVIASATKDAVIKKLAYLFMSVHAASSPEISLLSMNSLQKDARDDTPIIRGLALRTLSSLRTPAVVDHLVPLILKSLGDASSYVRRIAVTAALKLYAIDKAAFASAALPARLNAMLKDADASVCVQAAVVLDEVTEGGLKPPKALAYYLLNRAREMTEWQQVAVLGLCAGYTPANEDDLFELMNAVDDRLRSSNAALVIAAARLFLLMTQHSARLHAVVYGRLRDPLLTLAATAVPETAYVMLCHVRCLVLRNAEPFKGRHRDFFPRVSDPTFTKMVKLQLLELVASPSTAAEVVGELAAAATDPHASTARRAVRALGVVALRVPGVAAQVHAALLEMLAADAPAVRAEALVAVRGLARASGGVDASLQTFLKAACAAWQAGGMPDDASRTAFLWLLGEFAATIDGAPYILEDMVGPAAGGLQSLPAEVQLEALTAVVKVALRRPAEAAKLCAGVLAEAVGPSVAVDVRDRAAFYARLLAADTAAAERIVCARLPPAPSGAGAGEATGGVAELRDAIFEEFGTLAVVLDAPSASFLAPPGGVLCLGAVSGAPGAGDGGEDGGDDEEAADDVSAGSVGDVEGTMLAPESPSAAAAAPREGGALQLVEAPTCGDEDFARQWLNPHAASTPLSLRLSSQPPPDLIEGALARVGVVCRASGYVEGCLKLFFYAQTPAGVAAGVHVLAELVVDADGGVTATIKGDDPRAPAFAQTLRAALRRFVVSGV